MTGQNNGKLHLLLAVLALLLLCLIGVVAADPVIPVADFSATPLLGETPLHVQFTDLSTGPPTSWKWEYRLGSGSWTQFSTEQNASYTFTTVGSYRIRLTATNSLGSNTKSSAAGYITVNAAANPDLTITDMRPVGNMSFARESNSVKTTVRNIGGQTANATTLRLVAGDGFSGNATVPSLTSNAETIVTIVDTTVRNLAGGSVTYTATVDPDNTVTEASESNNVASNTYTVTYNGYKGKTYWDGGSNVTTKKKFDLHGNLLHSFGDSVYKPGGVGGGAWNSYTVTWTGTDISVPSGATIREARLYVPYTWDSSSQVPDHFSVTFNGNDLPDDTWYKDESNFGGYDNYFYGLLAYNVTSFFATGGNSAVVHKDDANSNLAIYGTTLAVVYEKAAEPRRQIFLNEEFDILGADESGYATTPEEATAYVPFSGMTIAPADVATANLTTFVPSGNMNEGVLLFNGNTIATNVWDYGLASGTQVAVDTRDVKIYLTGTGNEAGIRSTAGSTPLMAASQEFLVVTYEEEPEPAPVANFTANVTSGTAPLAVQFTDQSTNTPTSWNWSFGDGTNSTVQNATHTFATAGTYTVNLTATNAAGTNTTTKAGYITVNSSAVAPVANFTVNITSGTAPLTVQFTDTSTGSPTSWLWDFDDGDATNATVQHPVHTYAIPGTYTVNLTATNSLGSDSEVKTNFITVSSSVPAPVANFTAEPTTGTAPLAVTFTDTSENTPTSWLWNFGDGDNTNATVRNPVHTYASAGTYSVTLTATNSGGSNSTTKTGYITVTSTESPPVAFFTSDASSGRVPFTVHFTDTTTGGVSGWNWAFGDGSISTERNPAHTYVTSGTFSVTLTAIGPGGSNTTVQPNLITVTSPLTSPNYNGGIPLTTTQNGTVSGGLWYDAYPGFATSAQKTFTLPAYTNIKWARLYTVVYCGHMNNNYRGTATIGIDANGDSTYEIQKAETFNSTYTFPGTGGSGPIWFSDHMNRVTSDYLMWYDLTDAISGQTVNVQVTTVDIDPSFDGRVKAIVLVVAYDDGDSDKVQYWVNQGHDTVNKDDTTYTGSTVFGTNTLATGWNSANLTAIYLASEDGAYTFLGDTLTSGSPSGNYFGTNIWDVGSKLTAGEESDMGFTRIGEYYKIPLALMSVRYAGTTPIAPVAAFSGSPTSGTVPLTVQFTDESSNTPISWAWDFGDSDNTNATIRNPVHTYTTAGTYTVNLTATNAAGSNTTTKAGYITVSSGVSAPVAAFRANTTSGTAPLAVAFTDQSTNTPTSWKWEYKTGAGSWTPFSTDRNATYTFTEGTYDIRLNATNMGGSNTKTETGYITAGAPSIEVGVGSAAITFGTMSTSAPSTGSTQLNITTSGGTAWSVTAADTKTTNKGYMATTAGTKLASPFQLSNGGAFQDLTADFTSFMAGSGAGTTSENADVKQVIAVGDAAGDYAITVTFTGAFV